MIRLRVGPLIESLLYVQSFWFLSMTFYNFLQSKELHPLKGRNGTPTKMILTSHQVKLFHYFTVSRIKRLRGDFLGEIVTVSCCGSRFSQGAPNPEGVLKSIILQNFCEKLHENEIIWTRRRDTSLEPPRIRHWFLYTKFCYIQRLYTISWRDFIREACCQDVCCFIFMYVI